MPRTRGQDQVSENAQNYTDEKVGRAVPSWIADGHELKGIAISASGVNKIAHKLGRNLNGWMLQRVVIKNGGGGTNIQLAEIGSDKTTLSLVNGGPSPCTIDLWVW